MTNPLTRFCRWYLGRRGYAVLRRDASGRFCGRPKVGSVVPSAYPSSCDFCASQEAGFHYCLLHSRAMKNMDTVRCGDWTDRESTKEA